MQDFHIEVEYRPGKWRVHAASVKAPVKADTENEAVLSYVVTAKRPYGGTTRNAKGKRFRAVPVAS